MLLFNDLLGYLKSFLSSFFYKIVLIELVLFLLFPIILLTILLIFFFFYHETFEKVGFGKREIGLLIIGSASTMFLDFPLFIYKNYLLALNVGGALIPLILSYHFIKENEMSFKKILGGIILISVATYMVTRVTEEGVISYFPFYFIPPFLSILLSFLLFYRHFLNPVFAYTISTIGVIIGGDFSHLPELFEKPFMGSMGGAGLYDMVYLTGLISFCISFPFIRKEKRSKIERIIRKVEKEIYYAGKVVGIEGSHAFILKKLIGSANDYEILKKEINAAKAKIMMNKIINEINEATKNRYAFLYQRLFAFLIDFLIIFGITFIASFFYKFSLYSFVLFLSLIQISYFIIFESTFGYTVGKAFMEIEVRNIDMERDFITIFTRNIIRFLEMLAAFYLISIVLIVASPKKQRIGDIIADSIVVRR